MCCLHAEKSSGGTDNISFMELTKGIPFPVTYYTLTEKELEDNGYLLKQPGDFYSSVIHVLVNMTCILFVLALADIFLTFR